MIKRRDWKSASPMGNIPNRKTGYKALCISFFKMVILKNEKKEAIYMDYSVDDIKDVIESFGGIASSTGG